MKNTAPQSGPQDKGNIIPDCCEMTGTIRADRRDVMEEMISQIKKISEGIATPENKGTFGLHSDHFVLEERVIPEVAAVFAQFALSYLNAGGFAEEKV